MYQTKNLGLNITEIDKDSLQPFNFDIDLGDNFKAIDEKTLSHRNITNCLLEVPQNIKLELSDGTLTLKEGSVVYYPNGIDIFEKRTISFDINNTTIGNGNFFLTVNADNNLLATKAISYTVSERPETPVQYALYYNTTTNKIEIYDGTDWVTDCSLPIAIATRTETGFLSINQIFNGFGYMGSTVFVLPGVKGLIPNGRNEDGTFNNIEYTVPSVICKDFLEEGHTGPAWYIVGDNNTLVNSGQGYYISKDGYLIDKWSGVVTRALVFAEGNRESGVITSFTPRKPFQAVDYNDFQTKITELEAKIEALQAAVEALQG